MFFPLCSTEKATQSFFGLHCFQGLTSLLEFGAAFGAGYDDFTFALGDADFLATGWALVDVMGFAVGHVPLPGVPLVFQLVLPGQEFLVLSVAAVVVSGKHAVITVSEDRQHQADQDVAVYEDIQDYQDQTYCS